MLLYKNNIDDSNDYTNNYKSFEISGKPIKIYKYTVCIIKLNRIITIGFRQTFIKFAIIIFTIQ